MMIFTKLAAKMLAVLSIVAMMTVPPAAAQSLSASDMAFAFGGSAETTLAKKVAPVELASARGMTQAEMQETDGAAAPLVGLMAWNGARYVITQYVAPRIAVSALRSGCSVHCSTAQQAAGLARQAFGPNNVIRHGPSGHVRSPVHYSHFQAQRGFSGGHSFYGNLLR